MEDQGLKELLEANIKLSKENNRMLKKMRSAQKRANFLKLLYWLIIIGIAVGGFYFLQPYFEVVQDLYQQIQTTIGDIGEVGKSLPKL